jgi:DNA-binding beta-propeller fold protein YncE
MASFHLTAPLAFALALIGSASSAAAETPAKPAAHGQPLLFVPSYTANVMSVFDARDGKLLKKMVIPGKGLCCSYANPDQRTLYVTNGATNQVTEVDTRSMSVRKVITLSGNWADRGSKMPSDGKTLWLASLRDNKYFGIDTASFSVAKVFSPAPLQFANSWDGKWMFTVAAPALDVAATFVVRSLETGEEVARMPLPHGPGTGIAVSRDGKKLFLSGTDLAPPAHVWRSKHWIDVIDISQPKQPRLLTSIPGGRGTSVSELTPDGKELWSVSYVDGLITVIDTEKAELVRKIETGLNTCGVQFYRNRAYVLIADLKTPPSQEGMFKGCYWNEGADKTPDPKGEWRPGLDAPGAMVLYDRTTYKPTDKPPIPLPSPAYMANLIITP